MRGRELCAAAIVTALLLAGCGGSSKSSSSSSSSPSSSTASTSSNGGAAFKASYARVRPQLKSSAQAIALAIQKAPKLTDAQNEAVFGGLAVRWQAQITKLSSLTPPAKKSAAFNRLRDAAQRVESDLKGIVKAGTSHSASAAKAALVAVINDFRAAQLADKQLAGK